MNHYYAIVTFSSYWNTGHFSSNVQTITPLIPISILQKNTVSVTEGLFYMCIVKPHEVLNC